MTEIFFKISTTLKDVAESKPVVGSSKKIIDGFVNNSTPIEVLFRSPPDTPLIKLFPILVFAHCCSPNSFNKSSTFKRIKNKNLFYYSNTFAIRSFPVRFNLKAAVNKNDSITTFLFFQNKFL